MYFADVFAICDYTLHICATPPLPTRRRRRLAAAQRGARLHVNAPQITACPAKKTELLLGDALYHFIIILILAPFLQNCMNTLHVAIRCIFAEPVSVGPS